MSVCLSVMPALEALVNLPGTCQLPTPRLISAVCSALFSHVSQDGGPCYKYMHPHSRDSGKVRFLNLKVLEGQL